MKKLIPCFLLLITYSVNAQTFEGTIRWSMQMEITDPAMKAKMEEAKKKMNDPKEQAKMKEMQERMNDPQMKAMMDANPAMKAQMESAMKMMQSGDPSAMVPKGFVLKVKNGNILTLMEGGPMPMEMLYLKDKEQAYRLDRQTKTYSLLSKAGETQSADKPKVTKTNETKTILNYVCTKYLVELKEGDRTVTESIWATTDLKDFDLKGMGKLKMGRGQTMVLEGIDGVPLQVEASTKEANMVMEVTEIKKESLNSSDFTIPSDFKEGAMPGMGKF